jgi:hypothetical protein
MNEREANSKGGGNYKDSPALHKGHFELNDIFDESAL